MTWPLSQDYNEAVQDPALAFRDPELRAGEVVTNALGIPQPRSGNFADVYEFRCPTGNRWAVKCFTRETPDLQTRYSHISRHLAAKRDRLPFTVDFQYLAEGVRVRGRWYPVLKMRWVEGFLLNQFVRDNLEQPQHLLNLAHLWLRMGRRLRETGAAHGDLQHGNVILVPAGGGNSLLLRLIDYDGMYVPTLSQQRSSEVGHPSYQHPERLRNRPWNADIDRFPLLVVYTAIRAAAVGGRALWEKYDNGDNLLFREQDFRNTTESPLMRDLIHLGDPDVAHLANAMSRATFKPLNQVPLLDELVQETATVSDRPTVVALPVDLPLAEPLNEEEKPRTPILLWISALVGLLVIVLGLYTLNNGFRQPTVVASTPDSPEPQPVTTSRTTEPEPKSTTPQPTGGRRGPQFENGVGLVCQFDGHGDTVQGVGFTSDGQRVVAWSGRKLRLWEIANLREAAPMQDVGEVRRMAVSPRGEVAALARLDGSILLWNLKDWKEVGTLSDPAFRGNRNGAMTFDARGRLLVVGREGAMRWADWQRPERLSELKQYGEPLKEVLSVALSPNGEFLAIGCESELRSIRTVDGLQLYSEPRNGQQRRTGMLAALSDDLRFLTATRNSRLTIRYFADRESQLELPRSRTPIQSLAVSPDGSRALTGGENRSVYLWDLKSLKEPEAFAGHTNRVLAVAFSADGRYAVSGGEDQSVCVWRLPTGEQTTTRPEEPPGAVFKDDVQAVARRVAVSRDRIAAATNQGLRTWTFADGKPIANPNPVPPITAVAALPDGRFLLGGEDGALWFDRDAKPLGKHTSPVRDIAVCGLGRRGLTCGADAAVVWDLIDGKELHRFPGESDGTACVALSQLGRLVLTGGNGVLRLWDANTGKELRRFEGHKGQVLRAAFCAGDRYAVSTGTDGTIRIWHVEYARELRRYDAGKDGAPALAVSTDGRRVLVGGANGSLRQWEVSTDKELPSLVGHAGMISDVVLSPDARYSASIGSDGTIRLWRLADLAAGVGPLDLGTTAPEGPRPLGNDDLTVMAAELEKTAAGPLKSLALYSDVLKFVAKARDAGEYELAARLAAVVAKLPPPEGVKEAAEEQAKVVRETENLKPLVEEETRARAAADTLAKSPSDADACRDRGRFLCIHRGDWYHGLPLLARGSDAELAALARRDLGSSVSPEEQLELARLWAERSTRVTGTPQTNLRRRAYRWYLAALPGLTGDPQMLALDRLEELHGQLKDFSDPWYLIDLGGTRVRNGVAELTSRQILRSKAAYAAPVEVRVTVQNGRAFQLIGPGGWQLTFDSDGQFGRLRMYRPDDVGRQNPVEQSKPFKASNTLFLNWRVKPDELDARVDGESKLLVKEPVQGPPRSVALVAGDGGIDVKDLNVRRLKP